MAAKLHLPSQDTLVRSKCVPTRIEPGVFADPVKKPFGLHRNRSWPISPSCPRFLPFKSALQPAAFVGSELQPVRFPSGACIHPPTERIRKGPSTQVIHGIRKVAKPSPMLLAPVSNSTCLAESPLSRICNRPHPLSTMLPPGADAR